MASLRTMRHRIGYGKDTIWGENAADFREERQFWQIDERLDIDREIYACCEERELQAIDVVVNIAVQPVRCAHDEIGTDEMLEDAERRQCREDSCLIAGAGISAPSRPVQRHGRDNSPTMSA